MMAARVKRAVEGADLDRLADGARAQVAGAQPAKARRLKTEGSAGAHPIHMIPLDQLCLSDRNVRKTERDAYIESLADDIAANGLKQNLVVISDGVVDPANGKMPFQVVAGGRRFQALRLLAARGEIAAHHEVPCLIELARDAVSTSLSENLHKVAMNPADEFEAFDAVVTELMTRDGLDEGAAVKACARRFGLTEKRVNERLRLAALAAPVLAALRENRISLDAAKAYGGFSDQALQARVFAEREKLKFADRHEPLAVRQALRGETRRIDCAAMLFVGLDAYRAAGGRTETDLFFGAPVLGQTGEVAIDCALLDGLAKAKAEVMLEDWAERDQWAGALFCPGLFRSYDRPKPPKGFVDRSYSDPAADNLAAEERARCVAVLVVEAEYPEEDGDGDSEIDAAPIGWTLTPFWYFKPAPEKGAPDRKIAPAAPPKTAEDWAREREERERAAWIAARAAQLAVPKAAGTPFEGMAFWPLDGRTVERCALQEDEDGGEYYWIAQWIRVPRADAEAQVEAATAEYEARLARAAARSDDDPDEPEAEQRP